jgi:hypothetical protein
MKRSAWLLAVALVLAAGRAGASPTSVELEAALGGTTYATSWRGDYGVGDTLRAGVRFARVIAGDFQIWESYATVNHRANTGLTIGVTGYVPLKIVHPYARLFAIHQHEEGLVSVAHAPVGVLFGVGAGIRHRAGGGLSLGAEFPFQDALGKKLSWVLFTNVNGIYFPDDALGPSAYFGIDLGVGLDYFLQ